MKFAGVYGLALQVDYGCLHVRDLDDSSPGCWTSGDAGVKETSISGTRNLQTYVWGQRWPCFVNPNLLIRESVRLGCPKS
jgi:hypothetical protein